MSLEKVLSISGKPGLYKLTQQTRSGFLAESLLDKKKISVNARHNVSLLSEIAIYTLSAEVPLREIFQKIAAKEDNKATISHKVSKIELEEFFFEILPDYDEDRVYPSDIKKVVQWYNLLVKNDLTDFSEPEEEVQEDTEATKDKKEVKAKVKKEEKKDEKKEEVKKAKAKTKAKPKAAAKEAK